MLYSIHPTKRRMSARIAKLTEEYLACGGVIERVPSIHYYPIPSMKWIADKGMDYTSWNRRGGLGFGTKIYEQVVELNEGCFMTKSAPFEGDDAR